MEKELNSLQDVLSEEQNLALLDQVEIRGKNAIEARVSLGMELFFAPRDQRQFYPILNQLAEDYYQQFSAHLNCYGLTGSSRISLLKKNFLDKLHNKLTNINYQGCYDTQLFYDDTGRGEIFNASPWQAHFFSYPQEIGRLSSVGCSLPVCNEQGAPHFDTLAKLVVEWCRKSKPTFGTAGFCFAYSGPPSAKYTYAMLQRHPGIEQMDSSGFRVATRYIADKKEHFVNNRIKGVNWLTILCDELVDELGGLAHCKAVLEPECYVKEYEKGIIIFAGPVPQIGDSYQGIIPERYRKVARFTQPIRFDNYDGWGFLDVAEPLDSYEETIKWIRRFD